MEIKPLNRAAYAGKKFTVRYQTSGYYDIRASAQGFQLNYISFDAPVEKSFDDVFFGDWLENPAAFGAFQDNRLLGFVEGSMESWNNRFRISNICVFDHADRGSGIGGALMQCITETAEAVHARMLVLETQSCNEAAIAFYQKYGFSIIVIDLYSYSNTDPEQHEVRIEMGRKIN